MPPASRQSFTRYFLWGIENTKSDISYIRKKQTKQTRWDFVQKSLLAACPRFASVRSAPSAYACQTGLPTTRQPPNHLIFSKHLIYAASSSTARTDTRNARTAPDKQRTSPEKHTITPASRHHPNGFAKITAGL